MKGNKLKTQEKYILYVGNAYPHKNVNMLIQAMGLLSKKYPRLKLYIVSARNVFVARLEREIKRLKLLDYVKILGYVDDKKLGQLYRKSIAFVFPTLDEGFGLPPMEAIRAGTVIVQSDIPVLREVFKDNAFYFNPTSKDSIMLSIQEALALDLSLRQEIILKSQNFVKRYSWHKNAAQTLQSYKNAIK